MQMTIYQYEINNSVKNMDKIHEETQKTNTNMKKEVPTPCNKKMQTKPTIT